MAGLTAFKFGTGRAQQSLKLDEEAVKLLRAALTQIGRSEGQSMREAKAERDAIIAGERPVPPLLYNRFLKIMKGRGGFRSVRISEGVEASITPVRSGYDVVPGDKRPTMSVGRKPSGGRGKALRGRSKDYSVADQIQLKRKEKVRVEKDGRMYRDHMPIVTGPTMGAAKGEATPNIFAIGNHRGTVYAIEEISGPTPLPDKMPETASGRKRAQAAALTPYRWQARVLSHPWSRMTRGGFAESKGRRGAYGGSSSGMEGRFTTGELATHQFPIYTGMSGWKEAQADVEKAINRSYEYRVETGNIPPELERYVKEEIEKVRKKGKTPAFVPRKRSGSGIVRRRVEGRAAPAKKEKNPVKNGMFDDWKERREEAKAVKQAVKSKISAEAAMSRADAKEAARAEKRAEKRSEREKERASRTSERDRKRAAADKYRAEQIAEHGEHYGTTSYTIGTGLGKMYQGGRVARARIAKLIPTFGKGKRQEKGKSAEIKKRAGTQIRNFDVSFKKWESTVAKGKPDFTHLLNAYEEILVAHSILVGAGIDDGGIRNAVEGIRGSLLVFLKCVDSTKAGLLTDTSMKSARKLSMVGNPRNPTAEVHQEMGEGFLAESEELWNSYCKTGSTKTLLDAYRVLELACQEFEYTGDKKRMKQACDGIKAARAEIMSGMKKPAKKKAAKKRPAKKKKAAKKRAKKSTKKRTRK